jgi:hypothetical protein
MGYVDFVLIVLASIFEGKRVIVATSLFLHGVLIVCYVVTVTVPAKTIRLAGFFD